MVWPRRSAPAVGNWITPSRAPCGISGSVTLSSVDFGPFGSSARNQIEHTAEPLAPTILVPFFTSSEAKFAGISAGGGPAGSALYCPKTAEAARRMRVDSRTEAGGRLIAEEKLPPAFVVRELLRGVAIRDILRMLSV